MITEKEIYESFRQAEAESVNMTDEQIDLANLSAYKKEWGKYTWLKLYIHKMKALGINEFRLVINSDKTAMIHPLGKDGETLDFDF